MLESEFRRGLRVIFHGGYESSAFTLAGVLEEVFVEPCHAGHKQCLFAGERDHIVWRAKCDNGCWTEGYPEQFALE